MRVDRIAYKVINFHPFKALVLHGLHKHLKLRLPKVTEEHILHKLIFVIDAQGISRRKPGDKRLTIRATQNNTKLLEYVVGIALF